MFQKYNKILNSSVLFYKIFNSDVKLNLPAPIKRLCNNPEKWIPSSPCEAKLGGKSSFHLASILINRPAFLCRFS